MPEKESKVKITLISEIIDLTQNTDADGSDGASREIYEYSTAGSVAYDGSRTRIFFEERIDPDSPPSRTEMSFDAGSPLVVTMVRTGTISSAFLFDPDARRTICSYQTPIMPIEIVINTLGVANTINDGEGKINLDYIVETHGVSGERTVLELRVEKLPEIEMS